MTRASKKSKRTRRNPNVSRLQHEIRSKDEQIDHLHISCRSYSQRDQAQVRKIMALESDIQSKNSQSSAYENEISTLREAVKKLDEQHIKELNRIQSEAKAKVARRDDIVRAWQFAYEVKLQEQDLELAQTRFELFVQTHPHAMAVRHSVGNPSGVAWPSLEELVDAQSTEGDGHVEGITLKAAAPKN